MTRVGGVSFAQLKKELTFKVDLEAGELRASFITIVDGQEAVYIKKEQEAERIIKAYDPDGTLGTTPIQLAEVPNVAVEAEDLQVELITAAIIVVTKAFEWSHISAAIERVRLKAHRDIANAATPAQARIASNADWTELL